jgi:hypothetical protein
MHNISYIKVNERVACPAVIKKTPLNDNSPDERVDNSEEDQSGGVFFIDSSLYLSSIKLESKSVSVVSQRGIYHHSVSFGIDSEMSEMLGDEIALFDGGALNGNYVHPYVVRKYYKSLKPHIQENEYSVILGDQRQKVRLSGTISLRISITYHEVTSTNTLLFGIMGPFHVDVSIPRGPMFIVGLPDLFTKVGMVYKKMTDEAFAQYTDQAEGSFQNAIPMRSLSQLSLADYETELGTKPENCTIPWEDPWTDRSWEDDFIGLPESFAGARLCFYEKDYDARLLEYFDYFDEHINEGFRQNTKVVDLLKSKKYSGCFVPETWEGIKNYKLIKIEFHKDMPSRIVARRVRLNGRLQQAFEKEFERLTTYQFRKCNSPWASPMTVAPKATPPFIRFCICLICLIHDGVRTVASVFVF